MAFGSSTKCDITKNFSGSSLDVGNPNNSLYVCTVLAYNINIIGMKKRRMIFLFVSNINAHILRVTKQKIARNKSVKDILLFGPYGL